MAPTVLSKKIKLLQMLTNFHIGGTERQVANLALGIDPSHFDLHLACLRHSGELLAELETLRVPRSGNFASAPSTVPRLSGRVSGWPIT